MSKLRFTILAFGPIAIVAASIAFCDWLRSDDWVRSDDWLRGDGVPGAPRLPVANDVLVGQVMAGETSDAAPAGDGKLARSCRQAAARLQPRLGSECHVLVRPPLVIAGDLSQDELERCHRETIEPSCRAMAQRYFRTLPDEPITVLLFSQQSSYDHYAEKLFADRNVSIYGYYKPELRTLVMNIATGEGTLVHELTHALADFDFPKIPDWFNEGLASLHEQCRFREDEHGPWIEGLENWRLPGLQKAVRAKRIGTLESLVAGTDFRGASEGLNYAQARYFCLYMQRQHVLEDFYRRFRDDHADDPQGAKAVRAVFPGLSWNELDDAFRRWVLQLKRSS